MKPFRPLENFMLCGLGGFRALKIRMIPWAFRNLIDILPLLCFQKNLRRGPLKQTKNPSLKCHDKIFPEGQVRHQMQENHARN